MENAESSPITISTNKPNSLFKAFREIIKTLVGPNPNHSQVPETTLEGQSGLGKWLKSEHPKKELP